MPERINSFASLLPAAFPVLAFVVTVTVCGPVRADSVCIEQPGQQAPEGTHWSVRYDRPTGRKCWFLVDGSGRDATALLTPPSLPVLLEPIAALTSQLAALFASSTGAAPSPAPSPAPQGTAPQITPPQITPPHAPRKPAGSPANANRTDNRVRADQKNVSEGPAVEHASPALTPAERNTLFGEFLRWRDSQQSMSALRPWPLSQ